MVAAFILLMLVGLHVSRAQVIAARGGVEPQTMPGAVLALGNLVAVFILMVWGFGALPWYVPLATFVLGSMATGITVTRSNFAAIYAAGPVLALIVIGGAVYLLGWRWPY